MVREESKRGSFTNLNGEYVSLLRPGGKSVDSLMYSVATNQDDSNNRNNFLVVGNGTPSDHMANERTYVLWVFFSVFMIGVSISLLKGGRDTTSQVEGFLAALIGLVALISSTDRYFRVLRMFQEGNFEPNISNILFVVVIIFASAGISFAFCFFERDDAI